LRAAGAADVAVTDPRHVGDGWLVLTFGGATDGSTDTNGDAGSSGSADGGSASGGSVVCVVAEVAGVDCPVAIAVMTGDPGRTVSQPTQPLAANQITSP
jgi:hypothetical protein